MAIKDKNAILDELELRRKEYDLLYNQVDSLYADINSAHDCAYAVINNSAELVGSIRHCPISVKTKLKKIRIEKEKIPTKTELRMQERKQNIESGAASVAALGIGTIVATSFKDYFSKFARKLGKNGGWILAGILIIFVAIAFLFSKGLNRRKVIRKAHKAIKTLTKELQKLDIQRLKGQQHLLQVKAQTEVVMEAVGQLNRYKGLTFSVIEKEDRPLLGQLVNDTLALSALIDY